MESTQAGNAVMAEESANGDQAIGLAMEIQSTHDDMQAAVQQWRNHTHPATPAEPADSTDAALLSYVDAMKPLAFDYADYSIKSNDTVTGYMHCKSAEIMRVNTSVASQSNILWIAKEQATLRTNVPLADSTSCWVRVDESRCDVLKVMISGPEGTPYENGLFLFDVFLPSTYPDTAPLVQLQTTGRGSVRFNPNLYKYVY
jgi:baculoviral IAP repeat-containing protein 6